MASRKEYELLFKLNAQLGGSYSSTFSSAQKAFVSMQKEIEALSKTQSDISSYQKQQIALEGNRKKLEALQQQYDNIQREMSETGQYSADLQNKLLAKQMQIDRTSGAIDTQTAKLAQMGSALRSAGVNTDELTRESAELGKQIDELKAKQEEAADGAEDFGRSGAEAFSALQQAIAAAGIVKALQEIYEAFWDCADASMQFESDMTGVAKTTDLTEEEMRAMSEAVKEMSTVIPATTTELAAIAETAGQLGIEKSSLLDFTEIMAMFGTATKMTSEEAATMLAQFASITGMDPANYMNLGSTIVDLGNKFATEEKNIADMSQTIAAAGSIAGMTEADILGISAAVTSLGITAQNGGTSMMKLISDINSTVSSGEGLEDWARAAGMEAEAFADAWRDDAAGALDIFIHGLNSAYESGQDVYGMLSELGINESRQVTMITSLAKSGDRLTSTLNTANTAWAENTALTTEAEKRYATTQSQLTLMQNAFNNLKVAVGDNLNPVLQDLYKLGTQVLGGVTEFVQQNPALVKAVATFAGVLLTAVGVLAAYTLAVKVATAFSSAFALASGVALGPILLVVGAVAALTAAFVAATEANKGLLDESWELTAVSRAQYNELQELNEEYDSLVEAHQEASVEAILLKDKIEDLNNEYESGKQTLEEYKTAHQELIDDYDIMKSSHEEAYEKIDTEQRSVLTLISKLKELTATTDSAKENQQAILAIIDALNESVPNLAISYDDVVKNADGVVEALETTAKAQAAQKLLQEQWDKYVDSLASRPGLEAARKESEEIAKIAQQDFDIAEKAYNEALDLYDFASDSSWTFMATDKEGAIYDEAKKHLDEVNATLAMDKAAYEENEEAIAECESQLKAFQAQQEEAVESGENIGEVITDVTSRIAELAAAYDEAYGAALDSVQGQYDIWDKADKTIATSIDSINGHIEGQTRHWKLYNDNLASLSDRANDIEGLSDVIASFADGSKDSVNAVAGMASASDKDLEKMVKNWQALQQEQETTAGSLAEFETDFAASMDALEQELETTIGEMNLSEEAAEAGKTTIQGYIDAAKDKDLLAEVKSAYSDLADAAVSAFERKIAASGIEPTSSSGGSRPRGYASGTLNADMGWAWVGEYGPELRFMRGGEAVIPSDMSMGAVAEALRMTYEGANAVTAEEMRFATLPSQPRNEVIYAEHASSRGGLGDININPVYNITVGYGTDAEELREAVSRINKDLGEMIVDKIEDYYENKERKAYT